MSATPDPHAPTATSRRDRLVKAGAAATAAVLFFALLMLALATLVSAFGG
ncbi:hypothetical protein K8Z61_17450 [Nocardioides sp. TRM66260-LWL]|nr:hypothetical protein [Nocardioides sp. TRM66260-LWL]MBZ5736283.1 hypothetical protein [Nocardioides sp. TRM66260-LWL]